MAGVLQQLALDLGWSCYSDHYWRDFPGQCRQPGESHISCISPQVSRQSVSPSGRQTGGQSISRLVRQADKQSVSQSVNHPGRQSVNQSVRQSVSQAGRQTDRQADSQSVNQSFSQAGREPSIKVVWPIVDDVLPMSLMMSVVVVLVVRNCGERDSTVSFSTVTRHVSYLSHVLLPLSLRCQEMPSVQPASYVSPSSDLTSCCLSALRTCRRYSRPATSPPSSDLTSCCLSPLSGHAVGTADHLRLPPVLTSRPAVSLRSQDMPSVQPASYVSPQPPDLLRSLEVGAASGGEGGYPHLTGVNELSAHMVMVRA